LPPDPERLNPVRLNIMKIDNPTRFILEKRHTFQIIDPDSGHRLLIDVLENLDDGWCRAVLYSLGYPDDETLYAEAQSVEEAVSKLLASLQGREWSELNEAVIRHIE